MVIFVRKYNSDIFNELTNKIRYCLLLSKEKAVLCKSDTMYKDFILKYFLWCGRP